MNRGKVISGFVALAIYLSIIFMVLFFYNIHKTKAKNYVEKNSDRVTVTLVNSDKTVFNKSAKKSTPKKPVPKVVPHVKKPIVKKHTPKKDIPKKIKRASKPIPKPKKVIPKKVVPKKIVPKKVVPKKIAPKKKIPKKAKKIIPKPPKKKIPKKKVPKKKVPKKKIPKKKVPKKKVPKKTAKDLFSSINAKRPVKKAPKHTQPVKHPRPAKRPSSIKHNMSITDRIKATHQSGQRSNSNRDKGTEDRYKAKVLQHMKNWQAQGHKGQRVTIKLTVYQSGKFKYRVVSGVSGSMLSSLKRHLDFLNRRGLGRHTNSSPHTFTVYFKIRN